MIEPPAVETTEPFSGLVATPISCTASPSGSTALSGMSICTLSPAITRAVTVRGIGALLVSSSTSRTEIRTVACATCPSSPRIA